MKTEDETKTNNQSAIRRCTCANETQDNLYGKGMRVHNITIKRLSITGPLLYRCTVCGNLS